MLKRKISLKAILILPLLVQIALLSINFSSLIDINNPNYTNNELEQIEICQMKTFNSDTYQKSFSIPIKSKELSVIPEVNNIFCLGKVVEVFQDEKSSIIYVGTNRKVFNFTTLFNLCLFLLALFIFKDSDLRFIKFFTLILFVCSVFNLNWFEPQNFVNKIKTILIFLVPIIGLLEILKLRILNLFTYKLLVLFSFVIIITIYLEQISYTLRLNRDTYVWLNAALRMDILNTFEYKSTWEHKGSVIFWVYFFIVKFIKIYENIWLNIGLSFILFNSFCSYIVYKLLNIQFTNKLFNPIISFVIFLNLTFSPAKTTYSKAATTYGNAFFDTRIIGSLFLLLAVYFLIKKRYYYSSFYLIIAVLSLPSFLISSSIIFIFIVFYDLKDNKERMKLIATSLLFVSIYFLYLLVSKQIKEFYFINIKFNLLLNNVGEYYPIGIIIRQNIILFLNFAFILLFFTRLKKSYGRYYLITLIWSTTSLFHLFLTGPRWAHYETLIVVPFAFCGGFLFCEVYNYVKTINLENKKNYLQYLIVVIFLGLYSFQYGNNLDYKSLLTSENRNSNLVKELNSYNTFEVESSNLAIILVKDSEWDYLFNNYSFVPSTRTWPTLWHKRDEGWYALYPFDRLFDEEYFKDLFFDDIKSENPIYAILDAETESTHNNYLYDYVLNNYYVEKCERSYCIYKLKS